MTKININYKLVAVNGLRVLFLRSLCLLCMTVKGKILGEEGDGERERERERKREREKERRKEDGDRQTDSPMSEGEREIDGEKHRLQIKGERVREIEIERVDGDRLTIRQSKEGGR